jgi:carbonic anhydrase
MKHECVYVLLLIIAVSGLQESATKKSHHRTRAMSALFEKAFEQARNFKPAEKKKKIRVEYDNDMILQPGEKLSITLSDWLKISSTAFKNTAKFPPLILPSGEELKIKLDLGYYRMNDYFKPGRKDGPPSEIDFWFRMSGRNLYYAMNKEDMNVLGALTLKSLKDVSPKKPYSTEPFCFSVIDTTDNDWKLCAKDFRAKAEWVCKIKEVLGNFEKNCIAIMMANSEITVLTKKITQPIILVAQPSKMCNENWDYARHGSDWDCDCKEGKEQSPIDLPLVEKAVASKVRALFQYDPVSPVSTEFEDGRARTKHLTLEYTDSTLKINNNHLGRIVTLNGGVYQAQEIIFHTPSEHTINGKRYDIEMQIIHFGQTAGDIAKQVILSFLFVKTPGSYNKFIDDLDFFNLPNPGARERFILNELFIPKVLYASDDEDLPVSKPFSFYTYQGSLTQPPCTERTIHYVASKPIPLSTTVITLFQEAARLPDMMDASGNVIVNTTGYENHRLTQPLNGRAVYHFDHTSVYGEDPKTRKRKPFGHYEKVYKKRTEYMFVNTDKPSGLPGSFVVSQSEATGSQ